MSPKSKLSNQPAPDEQPLSDFLPWSLERRVVQLQTMLEVSRILSSTLDLETLLSVIVEVATELTATEAASILLLDEQTGELHFEAATGLKRAEVKAITVPIKGSLAGWILTKNEPLVVNDAQQDPRHYNTVDHTTKFDTRSLLGVPLQVKDRTIGVLEVLNKSDQSSFTSREVEVLETLAAQAAIAIENARLYKDQRNQMHALQEAQARLIQSEKLAAVGELVAGVAHELNNPLTSIIGYAELLQLNDLDDQARQDLDRVVTQAQRAAGIVRGLLDFARQHPPEWKPVRIDDVLNSALNLLTYELRTHNIQVQTEFLPNLPVSLADPRQLQQVFINLIHNARQAMSSTKGGGNLVIVTRLEQRSPDLTKNQNNLSKWSDGKIICIEIRDDGPGIPQEQVSRIFDPFFTTKAPGEGTGLGLSVCHGIITQHGGRIYPENKAGGGSTFIIELPVINPESLRQEFTANQTDPSQIGAVFQPAPDTARILVIDDEIYVLEIVKRILKMTGYQVDTVSSGEEGLDQIAKVDYNLVLCDVRMPDLTGLEVYQQAIQRNTNLSQHFVFMTGDTVSRATRKLLNDTNCPYLSKPFAPHELTRKVHDVLKSLP